MFKNIIKIGIDCCGCGNCFYICKKDAITLKTDDEGFIHPFVNYNCVDCGACLNVCPKHAIGVTEGFLGEILPTIDEDKQRKYKQ